MKFSLKILATAVMAVPVVMIVGCSAPSGFSYQNVGITLSAQCNDCGPGVIYNPAYPAPSVSTGPAPAGSVVTVAAGGGQASREIFTANVTNAPANLSWTLYPDPNLFTPNPASTCTTTSGSCTPGESGSAVGTITSASGSTAYYGAPSSVPVYSGAALQQAQALGIPQGMVLLVASVPNDPTNPSSVSTASQLIQIYSGNGSAYLTPASPTVPAGLTTPVAVVQHNGGTFQFYGGIVGVPPCGTNSQSCNPTTVTGTPLTFPQYSVDQNVLWAVGPLGGNVSAAIIGGNSTYGTISKTGLYTAPATAPSTSVVVYVFSELNTGINKSAIVSVK